MGGAKEPCPEPCLMGGAVDCLIFTKSRPAQLDLLLRSVDRFASSLYKSVTVLGYCPTAFYMRGYRLCMFNRPAVEWWWQEDEASFQPWLERWLYGVDKSTISFLCDDDVFYAPAPIDFDLPYSLRGGDYDYPFSLDGNIYDRDDVVRLLYGLSYRNPTQLEHQGHLHRDRLPFAQVNHGDPCLVGIPLNRVSRDSQLPDMGVHEYDLNEEFLAGRRLRTFAATPNQGAHAEIRPEWEAV